MMHEQRSADPSYFGPLSLRDSASTTADKFLSKTFHPLIHNQPRDASHGQAYRHFG